MCNTKGWNKCLTPGVSADDTKNFAAAIAGCSHDSSGWNSEPGFPKWVGRGRPQLIANNGFHQIK